MFKRAALLSALVVGLPAAAQTTTDCTTLGNTTRCTSDSGASGPDYGTLVGGVDNVANSFERGRQAAQSRQPVQQAPSINFGTPNERRSVAYLQVGSLISKGDCPGAIRLAAFYGQMDIIADTAKACEQ